jgi:hypothetical protein
MSRFINALGAGVCHYSAVGVDHPDLAYSLAGVTGEQSGQRFLSGFAGPHHFQAEKAITVVRKRLRGHRPDSRFGPDDIGHFKPVRLHCCSELPGG